MKISRRGFLASGAAVTLGFLGLRQAARGAQSVIGEAYGYGPLVPDGSNWKATMMIEFSDPVERSVKLKELIGIEDGVYVKVGDYAPVYAIADEDLDRETEEKTSSVHFLRFELDRNRILALRNGAALSMSIDHPAYPVPTTPVPKGVRDSLVNDLDTDLTS